MVRAPLCGVEVALQTHSPFASSSQISKKTMRSYLAWQGPAVERVIVLSFVAGTGGEEEVRRN